MRSCESDRTDVPTRSGRLLAGASLLLLMTGCTTFREWVDNGFKVGPNYRPPQAAVSAQWIDSGDGRFASAAPDPAWWGVFADPTLSELIATAARENLDLKAAGTRILQAQAQRNIAAGNLFPQTQQLQGAYAHAQLGSNGSFLNQLVGSSGANGSGANFVNLWTTGFNASWELDFWGRYRRAIESANAEVGVSVEELRDSLVMLTAAVATAYVQARTYQQRLVYARQNVEAQQGALKIAEVRLAEGRATGLDVAQAQANLAQTEATIPALEIGLRQANNQLCVLLARPARDLLPELDRGPIPSAPPTAAVGIPADLLERRPDVRRARRAVAAQSAQIGVAEADFYPSVGVTGFIGYASTDIRRLFDENSFTGYILPNFQWKILNYGRIVNNVRTQDAKLQERVLSYQQTVLTAGREVEDALVSYVQYQSQVKALERSVRAAEKSVELVLEQYREGRTDFNRVFTTQAQLATQQDQLAAARGNVVLGLINVYRALGGAWQVFDPEVVPVNPLERYCPPVAPGIGYPPLRTSSPTAPNQPAPTVPLPRPITADPNSDAQSGAVSPTIKGGRVLPRGW
ncbi:efflux transporter outer membrane subunit [Frigoriglobus tundricola]|uniref:Efflux transport system, outer membrane factor (OMF) lipoprotein n=1 Tax=Frigoriglobus tundricola TaxID=2774151 RepID=A0A6M5Z2L9_9BACT|nr:efflux transporter outer membrane subunit [Frigoriglobus tundricola]QJX00316.1 Efflux transport system, outer membrane factor (OMF) lipoprotein [Frigoriglobus tundricola]